MEASQSVSLTALSSELQQLCIEVRSDGQSSRYKAVERLDNILSTRKSEVMDCISSPEYGKHITWATLFNNTFGGLVKHAVKLEESKHLKSFSTLKNKNYLFSTVINKIIANAIEAKMPIKCSLLLEDVTNGIENSIVFEYFSTLLFQIVEKGVVVVDGHLAGVNTSKLNTLLRQCLQCYNEEETENGKTLSLLRCINKILDLSTKYSLICIALPEHLEYIHKICKSVTSDKSIQQEIIKLLHQYVCNVVVDCHEEIANLLQLVMPSICGYYDYRMKLSYKELFFELCAILLGIHYLEKDNFNTAVPIANVDDWKTLLKKILNFVKTEIKEKSHELNKNSSYNYSENFLLLASTTSYMVFWNPIFEPINGDGQRKIAKMSRQFQGILDLALLVGDKVNWGWFTVLSECMTRYYRLIEETDFQPMLQIVMHFQKSASSSSQIKSLTKYCAVLLHKEKEFEGNAYITTDFCNEKWKQIVNTATNQLLQNSVLHDELQQLVQYLVQFKKLSVDSLLSLIRSFTKNSSLRKDSCLTTILIAVKCYRQQLLHKSEIIKDLLFWLYPLTVGIDVKCMMNNKSTDPQLMATIVASLIVENDECVENEGLTFQNNGQASHNYDFIRTNLMYNKLKKIVFVDNTWGALKGNTPIEKQKLIVNDNYLKTLLETIDFDPQRIAHNEDSSDLINNMRKLETIIAILETFSARGKIDKNDICLSAVIKKAIFLLNTIEFQLVEVNIKTEITNAKDMLCILERIIERLNILDGLIRTGDNQSIIKYLHKSIAWLTEENDMHETEDIVYHRKLALHCIKVLAICEITEESFACIDDFEFNFCHENEVQSLLSIIEVFCKRKQSLYVAKWMIIIIQDICKKHHENLKLSLDLVRLLPAIATFIKPFGKLNENIIIILSSFLKKCYKKIYPPQFVRDLFAVIRDIAKIYCELIDNDDLAQIYESIIKFLYVPSKTVQYAVVDCLSHLIHDKWLFENVEVVPFRHANLCNTLFEGIDSLDLNEQSEFKNCLRPVVLQILLASFSLNYSLEEKALSRLIRNGFFCRADSSRILKKIGQFLNRDMLSVFKHNMFSILLEWLQISDCEIKNLESPPWAPFVDVEMDFLLDHRSILEFCALYCDREMLRKLSNRIKANLKEEIKNTFPICLAVLLPYFADRSLDLRLYGCDPELLIVNLRGYKVELAPNMITPDSVWIVLYHLIRNVWDSRKFSEFCGFSLLWPKTNVISYDNLVVFVNKFLSSRFRHQTSILDGLLAEKPIQTIRLLTAIKSDYENSYCIESRLHCFFVYCVALHCIKISLDKSLDNQKLNKVGAYLIRDAIYYLCNIIKSIEDCSLTMKAVLNFLCEFTKALLKTHSDYVEENLNLIVRTLVACITKELSADVSAKCIEALNALICENNNISTKSIAVLDDFPAGEKFQKLREAHEEIKYKRQTRSLVDEMNYFLEVEGRGITGFQKLRKSLADKKDELHAMCSFVNKSTDEIRISPVFKLLKVLLTSVKSKNANISNEAALCLGELGPVNLTTFALFTDMKDVCYSKFVSNGEALEYFVSIIISSAEHLLLSEKCTKASLCVDICEHFVNSKIGKKCLAKSPLLQIFGEKFDNQLSVMSPRNEISLLSSSLDLDFETWIVAFTAKIYANISNNSISALAAMDSYFCEQTIMAYLKFLLICEDNTHLKSIELMVNNHFEQVYMNLNRPKNSKTSNMYLDKAVVKYFLNMAECIRIHNQTTKNQLRINYIHVARACIYCEAYFMAVLYLELSKLSDKSKKIMEDEDFQYIAREAFTSIGYLDAMSGFLNPINSRLEYLSLQNNWHVVLLELDAAQKNCESSMYGQCLRQNGLYSLATTLDSKQQDYEVLWRLGNWDITKDFSGEHCLDSQETLEKNFQMHHYLALRSIKRKEEENVISAMASARRAVIQILGLVSSECAQSIYKYITWLQMIQQIEDFCELQFPTHYEYSNILQKWDTVSNMEYGHFDFKEQSISQKVTLFDIAGVRANRNIKEHYKGDNIAGELLLKLITECQFTGNKNLIIRNIAKLMNMNISNELKTKVFIEDAGINWKMGNITMAKSILYNIAISDAYAFCFKKVDALRIYGEYLAESNSESFNTIHRRFFMGASKLWDNFTERKASIAEKCPNVLQDYARYSYNSRKDIYKSIAKYADREYTQLNTRMNSEDFQVKIKLMGKNKIDALSIREAKSYKTNRDEMCTLSIISQNIGIDDEEIKTIDAKRTEYLLLAIENYVQYCTYDKSIKSMEVFRIISLWFSNKESCYVLEKLKTCIQNVPSYKFVCVLIQLAARIGSGEPEFEGILQSLLEKCSIEHPHHTLPYILAIAHASMDSARSSPRINVAKSIMNEVSKNAAVGEIVNQMQKSSKALIEFANKDSKECVHNTLSDNVRRLKNLDKVQCHTLEMPISVNTEYTVTSIIKWREKFTFVGGINAPKKITCLCSDGIERTQLLKGKDDLRQDAIMQQIFGIVNDMLLNNIETRKRKMRIRIYKVVPFSMRSGILEWCENTLPLGMYLTGEKKTSGAHKKYHPDDYPPEKCFKLLLDKHKATAQERLSIFRHVCEHFKPVFHYFFLENFLNPEVWFEKRLAYTNSVAINSMVGYILGLGDRHVQNILIDQITAEVIHIDFGIAFEQGKVMPTPETVPFRLTRDIVAPFGVCGVDGIFRKSCEKTMEVLRENQSVMMTVLEVLVYDPLYIWIVKRKENNEKVERAENVNKEQKNATAHRALIRVKAKLMGMEDVDSSMNSVEGQVQKLIKQAMDERHLSLLYPGWNPHL